MNFDSISSTQHTASDTFRLPSAVKSHRLHHLILTLFLISETVGAQSRLDVSLTQDRQAVSFSIVGDSDNSERIEFSDGMDSWGLFDANRGVAEWSSLAVLDPAYSQRYFRMIQDDKWSAS